MSEHWQSDHFFGHFITFENWLFYGLDPLILGAVTISTMPITISTSTTPWQVPKPTLDVISSIADHYDDGNECTIDACEANFCTSPDVVLDCCGNSVCELGEHDNCSGCGQYCIEPTRCKECSFSYQFVDLIN